MERLIEELRKIDSATNVLAAAVYPRGGDTGRLAEQGTAVEVLAKELRGAGGKVFRIMHGQIVALLTKDAADALVAQACNNASTSGIEVRATCVIVDGPREPGWLDALLGDLSLRRNFGSFSEDTAIRWIDGNVQE